jgi:hypothetical protein
MVSVGVGFGYFYWSLRLSMPAITGTLLTAWCIWLTADRHNLMDMAEQAADDANRADSQYDSLAEQHDALADHVDAITEFLRSRSGSVAEQITEPIPVQPQTVPMAEAWDRSAADLTDRVRREDHDTRLHTREFSGYTFQFRS